MKKQTLLQVFGALVFLVCVFSVAHGGVMSCAQGEDATSGGAGVVELNISIFEPTPSIDTSDIIQFRALSLGDVFPDTSYNVYSSFVVNGFDIQWNLFSEQSGEGGFTVLCPIDHGNELGPLPAGNYQITATWTHIGSPLPAWSPTSGTGVTHFSVVPEPSTFIMLLTGVFVMMGLMYRKIR